MDEIKCGPLRRDWIAGEMVITRAAGTDDAPAAPVTRLTFPASSETPIERFFGTEVLEHSESAVRLARLNAGAVPLLFNHNWDDPIGMVTGGRIADGRLIVDAQMFETDRAREVEAMINGGLRNVSIGYQLHTVEEEKKNNTFRATDWELLEVSSVTVPADFESVGIGRSKEDLAIPVRVVRAVVDNHAPAGAHGRIIMADQQTQQGTPDATEVERQRVKDILETGNQYRKHGVEQRDIDDAIRNGRTLEQFKDTVMSRMQAKSDASPGLVVGMNAGEIKRYSFGRALQAAVTGDWSKAGLELEASRAVEKIFGRAPEGFFIPHDVFRNDYGRRDFNVGTATEAGNLVATDLRTDLYTDALRAALVASSLGMRILTGLTASVAIPRKSSASTIGTLTEIGSASETAPAIAQATLSPKRVGAYIEVSKQALLQSAMALESMLRDDLVVGAAVLLENGIINGNGTAPQMQGIRNTTGIGTATAGTAGAAPSWAHIVSLETLCAAANAEPDRLAGYLVNTKTRGALKQTARGTNLDYIWQPGQTQLNGYRAAVTNNVPSNLTKGSSTTVCSAAIFGSDWSMAVLGLFGAPDVTVDPYTLAATGQVRVTLNQFADFCVRQPGAFAKIDDLLA